MLSRHINYFLAVAEHGSFTRAASALHVSQPALSQQIRQLEESLGVPLFDRSGRTIRLTDAGEVWRQYASRALQELGAGKRAIHDVADLTRGSLRIAVTPTFTSYFIGPLMADFYARYPGITLKLQEMSQEKIEDLLCRDELDVGIAFAPVHSPELEAIPLLTESLALVVAQHHPLAACEQVALSRLHDEKLVLLSAEFATREQIDHYCEKAGLHPQVVIEANSISAVLELIRRTSLSTLLPAAIATQHEGLKAISLAPPLLK
ncbi:TPA: transcriptional regulator CynR, partial [Escherichia coli]|nr:transcriptional regulator CynR [Escherichia coli]